MTDNQFNQLFGLITKSVEASQRLEEGQKRLEKDVSELKQDVSELKTGQERLEKETQTIGRALTILAEDSIRTRARVANLEDQQEISN